VLAPDWLISRISRNYDVLIGRERRLHRTFTDVEKCTVSSSGILEKKKGRKGKKKEKEEEEGRKEGLKQIFS
jgi:chlorite dismutase